MTLACLASKIETPLPHVGLGLEAWHQTSLGTYTGGQVLGRLGNVAVLLIFLPTQAR